MSTNIAQLRTNDPAAYNKRIQEEAAKIRGTIGMPQQSTVPAPTNMSGFNSTMPGLPTAPSNSTPTPPKDMSGFKSTMPNMGVPPVAPQSTPAPAPTNPAPNLTRTGNSVSGQLTPEQVATLNSLPPEARHNYIMGLTGMAQSAPGTPSAPTNQIPAPQGYSGAYPTMSPDQIKAEVAAKIAAETARRATAASQAKTGIQTSYNRLRTNIGQDRVLQDLTASRNSNPFSGRTSYDKGITNMERERTDREQSEDLQTRLASIDVSLQDYINATPEQQRAMENELTRQERDYALRVDEVGYKRQRDTSLDAITADKTAYERSQDKITNERNAENDKLARRKQHIDEANYYSDKYGITVEPKEDFQLVIDQVAGLPTVAQQTAAQKQQSEQRSEAWKVVEMLGSVPTYLADILGVPAGTQTQKAKEAAMEAANKKRMANIAQQNANASTRNAETSAKNAETAAAKTKEDADKPKPIDRNQFEAEVITNLDKMTPTMRVKALQNEKAAIINQIGLSGYNAIYNKYFNEYGEPK